MNVTVSSSTTYKLNGLSGLDPITVYANTEAPGRGSITIACYGQAWSASWPNMGDQTAEQFVCSVDEHYLASCLSSINQYITNYEALSEAIGIKVEDAVALQQNTAVQSAVIEHFGRQWYEAALPMKPNPSYQYLCRIILAVQGALRSTAASGAIAEQI